MATISTRGSDLPVRRRRPRRPSAQDGRLRGRRKKPARRPAADREVRPTRVHGTDRETSHKWSANSRGSALLAVLWLSLALSAIAFSVANTVHGETERVSTAVDGIRSYYLATGAIERGILYMQWGNRVAVNDDSPYYHPGRPVLRMSFPTGEAEVEVVPEA